MYIERLRILKRYKKILKNKVNIPAAAEELNINESLLNIEKDNIQDEPKIITTKQKKFSYNNEK